MEALAIVFVAVLFFYLISEPAPRKPPSKAERLWDGVKAVLEEARDPSPPRKKKDNLFEKDPWTVIIITILLGFILTYLL